MILRLVAWTVLFVCAVLIVVAIGWSTHQTSIALDQQKALGIQRAVDLRLADYELCEAFNDARSNALYNNRTLRFLVNAFVDDIPEGTRARKVFERTIRRLDRRKHTLSRTDC